MNQIKEFFKNIEKEELDENMQNLVSDGHLDSLDIIALVAEIEKFYKKPLKAEFIESANFESFEAIKNMLDMAMGV